MELTPRWKLIAGGAALLGVTVGGVAGDTGDAFGLNDQRPTIELVDGASGGGDEVDDSPNDSLEESTDSPFDSPDDPGFVDPSPESADSPNDSAQDSPAPTPATAPDSPSSPASPASADSPDSSDRLTPVCDSSGQSGSGLSAFFPSQRSVAGTTGDLAAE